MVEFILLPPERVEEGPHGVRESDRVVIGDVMPYSGDSVSVKVNGVSVRIHLPYCSDKVGGGTVREVARFVVNVINELTYRVLPLDLYVTDALALMKSLVGIGSVSVDIDGPCSELKALGKAPFEVTGLDIKEWWGGADINGRTQMYYTVVVDVGCVIHVGSPTQVRLTFNLRNPGELGGDELLILGNVVPVVLHRALITLQEKLRKMVEDQRLAGMAYYGLLGKYSLLMKFIKEAITDEDVLRNAVGTYFKFMGRICSENEIQSWNPSEDEILEMIEVYYEKRKEKRILAKE